MALLNEHNISLDDFLKKCNSVVKNPIYVMALKSAGAPINDIKRAIQAMSGMKTPKTTTNTSAPPKGGRTRFQRV